MGNFDKGIETKYSIKRHGNGMYLIVIKGSITVNGETLTDRDAIGISDTDTVIIKAETNDTEILLLDIPMEISPN